jgi:hypothetical protein
MLALHRRDGAIHIFELPHPLNLRCKSFNHRFPLINDGKKVPKFFCLHLPKTTPQQERGSSHQAPYPPLPEYQPQPQQARPCPYSAALRPFSFTLQVYHNWDVDTKELVGVPLSVMREKGQLRLLPISAAPSEREVVKKEV